MIQGSMVAAYCAAESFKAPQAKTSEAAAGGALRLPMPFENGAPTDVQSALMRNGITQDESD